MTQTLTQTAEPTQVLAPIVLTPPEEVTAVVAEQAAGAVELPEAMRQQVDAQLTAFLQSLTTANVESDEFRNRLDQAFSIGRKEIAEATALSNSFTRKNFVGETDTPAYKAISEMRALFDELNPANQGDLFTPRKILGMTVPFGDRLTKYLRRYQSAEAQIGKVYDDIIEAKGVVERGVFDLGEERKKLWSGLQKLEAVVYFITQLDSRLSQTIEAIRVKDPNRARALETEVLYYVRQNVGDVQAMEAVVINAYNVAGELRKTGREVINGCDRVSTLGMAALTVAVTLARSTGVQIKTMAMLEGAKSSIEGLIVATGDAFNAHVKATTNFANNPMLGIQTLQSMFNTTYAGMDTLEKFRLDSLKVTAANNEMLGGVLRTAMVRIRNSRAAEAGDLSMPAPMNGIALG